MCTFLMNLNIANCIINVHFINGDPDSFHDPPPKTFLDNMDFVGLV